MNEQLPSAWLPPPGKHAVVVGRSGTGKTYGALATCRAVAQDPSIGGQFIDPEGDISSLFLEFAANPSNGVSGRTVHYFRPASKTHCFGLPMLHVDKVTPQACHDAALRTRTVFEQVLNFGTGEYGPRLSKLFHLGCFGLALTGRPLVHLPDLFTLGAAHLRALVGDAFPYQFVSEEWRTVDVLAERNPSRFLEYSESLTSRMMPVFGSACMRRAYGQEKAIDFKRMFANRDIALLDLSGLEHKDAVLIGTSYNSLLYHNAMQQPAGRSPRVLWMIDEVSDYMTPDIARGFDRLRKRGVQLYIIIQRPSKFLDADDGRASILIAVLTNSDLKIVYGGLSHQDAELMAYQLFPAHIDLQEWKQNSLRPVAVGQRREITHSSSLAEHTAEHESTAETNSSSVGIARSHMHATTHGISDGISVAESTSIGDSFGTSSGIATGSFEGSNTSQAMTPALGFFDVPQVLSRGAAQSTSTGSTAISARSAAHAASSSSSSGRSAAVIEADTDAYGETESESYGVATSTGRGTSRGESKSHGESEVFVTNYEWMPSTMYSLQEQMHRLTAELMNLPHRECFVKVQNQAPYRTRTPDLAPAFRSAYFKRTALPLFLNSLLARSPYLRPHEDVDAEIEASLNASRVQVGAAKQEPESHYEPLPDPPPPPCRPTAKPPKRGKPALTIIKNETSRKDPK